MSVNLQIENGFRFNLKDLKEALPHSDAVKELETLEAVAREMGKALKFYETAHCGGCEDKLEGTCYDFGQTANKALKKYREWKKQESEEK